MAYLHRKESMQRETLVVSEAIRRTMQGNKSSGTSPEIRLRRALWNAGVRGYRVNVRSLPGTPDLAFKKRRTAIFVHGCFWHGCPHCSNYRLPKTNTNFWAAKLNDNRERDQRVSDLLSHAGYSVLVFWECQIERDASYCAWIVKDCLATRGGGISQEIERKVASDV
jgi:DNA mismatch endonuclease (patch repair protein)